MTRPSLLVLVGLALPLCAASGQRIQSVAFRPAPIAQAMSGHVRVQQTTAQCRKSVLGFAGQFLAGTGGAVLSALAFSAIKPADSFDDYGFHGDSYGSTNYLTGVLISSAIGAAGGVWISASRPCRAFLPALVGASLPTLLLMSAIDGEADAIATGVSIVFGLPSQALLATVLQMIAR